MTVDLSSETTDIRERTSFQVPKEECQSRTCAQWKYALGWSGETQHPQMRNQSICHQQNYKGTMKQCANRKRMIKGGILELQEGKVNIWVNVIDFSRVFLIKFDCWIKIIALMWF